MTRAMLAAFVGPEPLRKAAEAAVEQGRRPLDAFTPFPVEGLADTLSLRPHGVRTAMLLGGFGVAGLMYFIEWWSAVHGYVINSGGRAPHSWPAFMLAPAEVGILGAAVAGFITLLIKAGLPRLNHPLFEHQAFEHASQDQFLLALPMPQDADEAGASRRFLFELGAVWVEEAEL